MLYLHRLPIGNVDDCGFKFERRPNVSKIIIRIKLTYCREKSLMLQLSYSVVISTLTLKKAVTQVLGSHLNNSHDDVMNVYIYSPVDIFSI